MDGKRFYVAKSCVYGVTVYDRRYQTPAFSFGAEIDMDDVKASMLAVRLNIMVRKGLITDETDRL